MEWSDEGMLLSVRKHGEGSAIVEIFTQNHGRHAGVVRGGGSRKAASTLQPGTQLAVTWRARLEDHLGSFSVEQKFSRAVNIMSGRDQIASFSAITSLLSTCLPERETQPHIYSQTMGLVDDLTVSNDWVAAYVQWEMLLLNELGFGIDLTACAATGRNDGLAFVSPKSGRAVSSSAAVGWENRLLKLPSFLLPNQASFATNQDLLNGLSLTGYFLENGVISALGRKELPQARKRFVNVLAKKLAE